MGKQNSCFVVNQAFSRRPSHPLDESACNLSHVDAGVDRLTDVHQQIDTRNSQITREAINFDFRDRSALGEVEKRIAATGFAIEVDAGCLVKTSGTKINSFHPGFVGKICERDSASRLPRVTDHRIGKHDMLWRRNQTIIG